MTFRTKLPWVKAEQHLATSMCNDCFLLLFQFGGCIFQFDNWNILLAWILLQSLINTDQIGLKVTQNNNILDNDQKSKIF